VQAPEVAQIGGLAAKIVANLDIGREFFVQEALHEGEAIDFGPELLQLRERLLLALVNHFVSRDGGAAGECERLFALRQLMEKRKGLVLRTFVAHYTELLQDVESAARGLEAAVVEYGGQRGQSSGACAQERQHRRFAREEFVGIELPHPFRNLGGCGGVLPGRGSGITWRSTTDFLAADGCRQDDCQEGVGECSAG
jgi:hypothetical protein